MDPQIGSVFADYILMEDYALVDVVDLLHTIRDDVIRHPNSTPRRFIPDATDPRDQLDEFVEFYKGTPGNDEPGTMTKLATGSHARGLMMVLSKTVTLIIEFGNSHSPVRGKYEYFKVEVRSSLTSDADWALMSSTMYRLVGRIRNN